MHSDEWLALLAKANILDPDCTERHAKVAYVRSIILVEDQHGSTRMTRMMFNEFLEAVQCVFELCVCVCDERAAQLDHVLSDEQVGRIAHVREPSPIPLSQKLPGMIEAIIDTMPKTRGLRKMLGKLSTVKSVKNLRSMAMSSAKTKAAASTKDLMSRLKTHAEE